MKQCYSPSTDAAEKNRPRIRNLALALLFALLSLSVGIIAKSKCSLYKKRNASNLWQNEMRTKNHTTTI